MHYYLLWYGLAALCGACFAVKTYMKKGYLCKLTAGLFAAASLLNITYLARIYSTSLRTISVSTSLYFVTMDILVLFLFNYVMEFTGAFKLVSENRRIIHIVLDSVVSIDALCLLLNIFFGFELQYRYISYSKYAVKYMYSGTILFTLHLILIFAIVILALLVLLWKTLHIPSLYRARYLNSLLALLCVTVINALYILEFLNVSMDITVFIYGYLCPIVYWNTFDYSSKSMLNSTRKMILEYMGTPMILFDYEGYVADSNKDMRKLFPILNNTEVKMNMMDFMQIGSFKLQNTDSDQVFEWYGPGEEGVKAYQCNFNCLRDEKGRVIGKLFTLRDLEVERDMLTQLYSKQSFWNRMKSIEARGVYPITVVVCNANQIGLINDVYGWEKGNQMIRLTADLLRKNLPETTILARMEDGDIAAGFLEVEQEYAVRLFENIREQYQQANDTGIDSDLQYGIAVVRNNSQSIEAAVKEAGESLQTKKLMAETSKMSSQLDSLKQTLTESDYETEEHVERTKAMAIRLGKALNLPDSELSKLALLAVLHDIGKIAIPHSILLKQGKLTDEEWAIMKTHTEKGYRIAYASNELQPIAEYILHHHERYDGKGYPSGLVGEDIPLLSRIITVVDSHDVMIHDRPYHNAMSPDAAVEELLRCSGSQFDPHIVTTFLKVLEDLSA